MLRAEEWRPSTPRHLQLLDALGFEPPQFAHLPMIMGPDRAKLSKRHGATAIGEYKHDGYLPEATRNFMVLLGWSLDDKTEVMPTQTIIDNFTLDRVTKSAAIFDQEKLLWMNGMYIRDLTPAQLAGRMTPFLERDLPKELLPIDSDYLTRIAPLLQERIKRLDDAANQTEYFFKADQQFDTDTLVQKGMDREMTLTALKTALEELTATDDYRHENLEQLLNVAGEKLSLSRRQFFGVLRVAATGRAGSPPFVLMLLPIALPGLFAAFILSLVLTWNEYFFAALLTSTDAKPLPVMVASQTGSQGINWWSMAALSGAAIAPLVVIGIVLERYIIKGMTAGAVK